MSAGYQLILDLGAVPSTPAMPDALLELDATRPPDLLELDVVVCHVCTARHPVERCPRRVACALCSGPHLEAEHARSGR